jgi:hypothetical protein
MNSPKLSVWLFKLRFRRAAHNYELILCDILAKFGNVQKLTMVHKDYKTDRIREGLCEEGWSAPFAFLEPVDVCRRPYMFEHLEYHVNHESELAEEGNYLQDDCIESDFDEARDSEINRGVKSSPRPIIEHKAMMTPTMRAKFEALQQAYEDVASCQCYESETVRLTYED